jgi:regulator of nucleoside diphosphate kinase
MDMNESTDLLTRTITDLDEVRLMNLLRRQFGAAPPPLAQSLLAVLDHADVVAPQAIAADVVTMGSRVALALASGETRELSVVYPEDANADEARMSILSPIGAALLGAHVGDAVSWQGTGGAATQAQVQAVLFQPEAAGDYTA